MCIILYLLGSCYYLSLPALSNEMKGRINRALSHTETFRSSLDTNGMLDRQSFSAVLKQQNSDLIFTPRESALIFNTIDKDGSGKISLKELTEYAKPHGGGEEGPPVPGQ